MYIGNLTNETHCEILAKDDKGRSMRFETTVLQIINETSIKVTPCRHEGKLLNFGTTQCILEAVIDDRFYQFPLNEIQLVRGTDETYAVLTCNIQGKSKNRRGAVRIPLGGTATIRVLGKLIPQCRLYDLSATGIGLSVPTEAGFEVGQVIEVAFRHNKWDEDPYQITGEVVRVEEFGQNNLTRIGVEFRGVYRNIDKLIAELQRDRATVHRRELLKKKL